jgi:hypothetical protein
MPGLRLPKKQSDSGRFTDAKEAPPNDAVFRESDAYKAHPKIVKWLFQQPDQCRLYKKRSRKIELAVDTIGLGQGAKFTMTFSACRRPRRSLLAVR